MSGDDALLEQYKEWDGRHVHAVGKFIEDASELADNFDLGSIVRAGRSQGYSEENVRSVMELGSIVSLVRELRDAGQARLLRIPPYFIRDVAGRVAEIREVVQWFIGVQRLGDATHELQTKRSTWVTLLSTALAVVRPNVSVVTRRLEEELQITRSAIDGAFKQVEQRTDESLKQSQASREELNTWMALVKEEHSKKELEIATQSERLDDLVTKVEQTATNYGIVLAVRDFAKTADTHRNAAVVWLVAAALFGFGLAYWLCVVFDQDTFPLLSDPVQAAQLGGMKLLVTSFIAYGIVICVRNYAASRHNAIVNRHRQNALQSWKTFEGEDRTLALAKATEAIFAPQPTGYGRTPEDRGTHVNISDIVKAIEKT